MKHPLPTGPAAPNFNNLFVAGLPRQLRDPDLMALFHPYNPRRAAVMMDVNAGRSKGFAFLLFESAADGQRAVAELNGKFVSVAGTSFQVHVSPSRHDGFVAAAESPCVYFRNIPLSTTYEKLRDMFAQYGRVLNLETRPDSSDTFLLLMVEYGTVAEARAALSASHGKVLFPGSIAVMAKFADSADMRAMRRKHKKKATREGTSEQTAPQQNMNSVMSPPGYDEFVGGSVGTTPTSSLCSTPRASQSDLFEESFHSSGAMSDTERPHSRSSGCGVVYRHDPYTPEGFVSLTP